MLQPGYRIGNYEVIRGLGAGGQGMVYLARHVTLDRLDAVKVLQAHLAGDPEARQRFEQEAVGAARLHHPHIAGVHDAGQATDGSWYVAMQYVDGPSLDRLIPSHGLSLQRTVGLIGAIADALDAAHAHGLVHRDVKPANVMVAAAGTATEHAYLVDFGIAKLVGGREGRGSGRVMGSYGYIAPERIEGGGDARSDQYALACTAFHCLTGAVPFPGTNEAAAITAHLHAPPPPATSRRGDLPKAVDAVLARGMAKDPAARYPSCTAFATALREAASLHNGVLVGRPTATVVARTKVFAPVWTGGWLPPRAASVTRWDTGRHPQVLFGVLVAGVAAFVASVPLQRIVRGRTAVPIELSAQFAILVLLTLIGGGLGTWLLTRRSSSAWFLLLLSALTAPALRAAIYLTGNSRGGSMSTALQWVAFQPLESGYSAFTVTARAITLSRHGLVLIAICVATAAVYILGWWVWSTGTVPIGRVPRGVWPWLGGAAAAVFVTVLAVGDLPAELRVFIAIALALSLVAAYMLARKYIEGWLFFMGAQLGHFSYALSVSDSHRPPSMRIQGLLSTATPISASTALYYLFTLALGMVGLLIWAVDLRRAAATDLAARRFGPAR